MLYDVSGVQFSRRLVLGVVRGFYDGLSGLYADINFHIPASKMFNDLEVGSLTGIPQSRPFGVCAEGFGVGCRNSDLSCRLLKALGTQGGFRVLGSGLVGGFGALHVEGVCRAANGMRERWQQRQNLNTELLIYATV